MSIPPCTLAALCGVLLVGTPAGAELPGFEIVPITDSPDLDHSGSINNCGEVVFSTRIDQSFEGEEIFLYDNGRLTQVTDNDVRDAFPDINDNGVITWVHEPDVYNAGQIVLYADGETVGIGFGGSGSINNAEHLAFKIISGEGCGGGADTEIFFYDGEVIEQVTDLGLSNQVVRLNDSDAFVWTRYDFCQSPWQSEVMLYSNGTITQLTDGQFQPQGASINNIGQVAWSALDSETMTHIIYVWQDGEPEPFPVSGRAPQLNDLGHMEFARQDGAEVAQVWFFRDGDIFQVTDDVIDTFSWDINDWDEMVLELIISHVPIQTDRSMLRRIRTGDSGEGGYEAGFDGDIDLRDFAVLQRCFTGEGDFDRLCDCRFLDIDHDRDVDLDDFALYQAAMTGPE